MRLSAALAGVRLAALAGAFVGFLAAVPAVPAVFVAGAPAVFLAGPDFAGRAEVPLRTLVAFASVVSSSVSSAGASTGSTRRWRSRAKAVTAPIRASRPNIHHRF